MSQQPRRLLATQTVQRSTKVSFRVPGYIVALLGSVIALLAFFFLPHTINFAGSGSYTLVGWFQFQWSGQTLLEPVERLVIVTYGVLAGGPTALFALLSLLLRGRSCFWPLVLSILGALGMLLYTSLALFNGFTALNYAPANQFDRQYITLRYWITPLLPTPGSISLAILFCALGEALILLGGLLALFLKQDHKLD